MEISRKHWTVRLIQFSLGFDSISNVRDTCGYRGKLIGAILLLPVALILSPFTLLYKLILKDWIHCLISFVITFLILGIGIMFYTMFYAMWVEPKAFIPGCMEWVGTIVIIMFILHNYYFNHKEDGTVKELIKSYKEKYCKPIDFK